MSDSKDLAGKVRDFDWLGRTERVMSDPEGTYLDVDEHECAHPVRLTDEFGNVLCVYCNDQWWEDPL